MHTSSIVVFSLTGVTPGRAPVPGQFGIGPHGAPVGMLAHDQDAGVGPAQKMLVRIGAYAIDR